MNSITSNFLEKERVGVVSIVLSGGTPHSSTVHYSQQSEPFKIFIQTVKTTVKAKELLVGSITRASFVVGFSEEDWVTVQMRGNIQVITDSNQLENASRIHYTKIPEAEQYKSEDTIFLEFIPDWFRYTDFNTEPETIIEE